LRGEGWGGKEGLLYRSRGKKIEERGVAGDG